MVIVPVVLVPVVLVSVLASTLNCGRPPPPPPPAPAPTPIMETPVTDAGLAQPEPEPPDEETRPDAAPEMVTIKLIADQRKQAHVFWGRKDLGVAPLEVTRPRGSGPLDLVVLAEGYLPLHTRAFTERNETLVLRLYTAAEASGLPGYSPAPTPTSPGTSPGIKNPGIKPTTGTSKPHP